MKYGKNGYRFIALTLILLLGQFASTAYALNRNTVFAELENINTNWNDISIKLWINDFENDPDPGVIIGDRLTYHVNTDIPGHFAFVFVDAKGSVAVLKPDALEESRASNSMEYPSNSSQGLILQAEPLGRETIYLIASDQNMPSELFGIDAQSDFFSFGPDLAEVRGLVTRLNAFSETNKLSVKRYTYLVDSDTQISTRGIRREVSDRIEEVEAVTNSVVVNTAEVVTSNSVTSTPLAINDIKFEYDSDVLTDTGINQLEILGSELVDRQEQNDLPSIRLTGHTDSIGSAEYNMELSKNRSKASKRFLIEEFGLPAESIETHGLGESSPMDTNDSEIGRSKNRRVEFEIVQ